MYVSALFFHLAPPFTLILGFRLPRRKHRGIKPTAPVAARLATYTNKLYKVFFYKLSWELHSALKIQLYYHFNSSFNPTIDTKQ